MLVYQKNLHGNFGKESEGFCPSQREVNRNDFGMEVLIKVFCGWLRSLEIIKISTGCLE